MSRETILRVENLHKHYAVRQSLMSSLGFAPKGVIRALDGVSFTVGRGEILGVVGESGSGKTTIAMAVMDLIRSTSGEIILKDRPLADYARKELRRKVQMIFQDPYEALNPRQTVYQSVAEPLTIHGIAKPAAERRTRVFNALDAAGLKPPETYAHRHPDALSGGQRQRVIIAGALVLEPEFIVADEPVSMLDVSIRAEILNLLRSLRDERNVSILYITHDLATAAFFTDRIVVMYLGRIVEIGPTQEVLQNPQHPYTKALLSVIPVANPRRRRERQVLKGEIPNAAHIPQGCRFHPRCPVAEDRCRQIDPQLIPVQTNHSAACLLVQPETIHES